MSVDIKGWIILLGPTTLLGNPVHGALSPVYTLEAGQVQGPRGQVGIAHRCTPVAYLASIRSVTIPDGATFIMVDSLSAADRATLAGAVEQCEHVIGAIRAAQSGIVVAPETSLDAIRGSVH